MSPSKPPKREDAAKQKKELPAEGGHPSAKGQEYHTNMPVGEVLRRAREHFGQSLADVESAIRIRAIQIEAIEQGHYEKLPGRVYAIGFVRSYSEYLGFDGDKMVALFKSQSAGGGSVKPELNFPAPASESRVPSVGLIVVGLVLLGAFMAFWSSGNNVDTQDVADIPPVSSPETAVSDAPASAQTENAAASSVSSPAVATAPVDGEAAAAPSVVADSSAASAVPTASSSIPLKAGVSPDAAQTSANPVAVTAPDVLAAPEDGDTVPEEEPHPADVQAVSGAVTAPEGTAPAPVATQAETGATATPAPSEQGAAAAASAEVAPPQEGITLNVKESSWVEIRDESGKAIVSRMLKTGDQYFVPNRPDLKMSLGNAGGIEVTMDGKPLPPFGKKGEVRRNIPLDITVLKSLAAGHE